MTGLFDFSGYTALIAVIVVLAGTCMNFKKEISEYPIKLWLRNAEYFGTTTLMLEM